MNIKTNLAKKRAEANITQKELAENTGVELRSIRAYESGERDINKGQWADIISSIQGAWVRHR